MFISFCALILITLLQLIFNDFALKKKKKQKICGGTFYTSTIFIILTFVKYKDLFPLTDEPFFLFLFFLWFFKRIKQFLPAVYRKSEKKPYK